METIELKRDHDKQYFDKMLKNAGYGQFIPTNCIVDKTLPNIGATTAELLSPRHSIILEPFKAVIEVKKKKVGDKLCAVIAGVTEKEVYQYLVSDVKHKKIMTTPESFPKVIRALKKYDPDYRKNFFMLIDECEKLVQDCLFRNKILIPLAEFFLFDNKALISATPVCPTAKEFQEFDILKVEPQYTYQKDLLLLITNNINTAARNYISTKRDNSPFLIFTNCKHSIAYLSQLDIVKDDNTIFCAEDLDKNFFQEHGVLNVKHSVVDQKYKKFNFFTSRFFSAVDMLLPKGVKPHVLILTNITKTRHSLIEPSIDSVQIYGRARKGVASITHITNLFSDQSDLTDDIIKQNVKEEIQIVDSLYKLKKKYQYENIGREINSLVEKEFASLVFNPDGSINDYYKDNFLSKRLLKFHYTNPSLLLNEYKKVKFFNTIKHIIKDPISDLDKTTLGMIDSKQKRKKLALLLHNTLLEYADINNTWDESEFQQAISEIKRSDEFIYEAYKLLGIEFLEKVHYNKTEIKKAIFEVKKNDRSNELLMIDMIISEFTLNVKHYCYNIKSKLQAIYDQFDIYIAPGKRKKAKGTDIEEYFEFKNGTTSTKIDGQFREFYILHRPINKLFGDLKFVGHNYPY